MAILEKICPICGKSFVTTRKWKKFCSKECSATAQMKTQKERREEKRKRRTKKKVCPICGAIFYSYIKRKIYCSNDCYRLKRKLAKQKNAQEKLLEQDMTKDKKINELQEICISKNKDIEVQNRLFITKTCDGFVREADFGMGF